MARLFNLHHYKDLTGTRISELFPDIPKPLIPFQGITVLEHKLISLRNQGILNLFSQYHICMIR